MSERPVDDDLEAPEREDDPRGRSQSKAYRTADPRDIVVEGDVAMSGPAGAPQERDPELREDESADSEEAS